MKASCSLRESHYNFRNTKEIIGILKREQTADKYLHSASSIQLTVYVSKLQVTCTCMRELSAYSLKSW